MRTPILVTGAAGFAGSHLVDFLARDHTPIVAWYRPDGRAPRSRPPSVEWRAVDILNRDAVEAEIDRAKPQAVYHCSGAAHIGASWNDARGTFERNVLGTHHLVEALERARAGTRLLIPSSASVYKPSPSALGEDAELAPANPYALSKLAQELFARQAEEPNGVDLVVARAFNHIGPGQEPTYVASSIARQIALIESGRAQPVLEVGNIDARRDLTDVRDTVRAYRLLVEHGRPRVPYNVCSGRACSVRELIRALVTMAGIRVEIRVDPARYRPSDPELVLGDPTRIQTELGWKPEISLTRTLSDLLEYWRERVRTGGP